MALRSKRCEKAKAGFVIFGGDLRAILAEQGNPRLEWPWRKVEMK